MSTGFLNAEIDYLYKSLFKKNNPFRRNKPMPKKKEVKLPEKLSACILLALKDLEKTEKDKRYYIDFDNDFHTPNGKCVVCFAGSVMAQTLKVPIEDEVGPANFSNHNANRLRALDAIRSGNIDLAFSTIKKRLPFGLAWDLSVTFYGSGANRASILRNNNAFKQQMKTFAGVLKKFGE